MTYELAKELKDAGFPQDGVQGRFISLFEKPDAYVPTLSELIEACGKGFSALDVYRSEKSAMWWAYKYNSSTDNVSGQGSTPEEAVANLWLALNKK